MPGKRGMRIMNRKIWIILLAALLAMDALTACTPSTGPNPAKEPTASVEVPAGFELMDISSLVKDQKIAWFDHSNTAVYSSSVHLLSCMMVAASTPT